MKITFLGTNGWYTTHTGSSTCVFVETETEYMILDAGMGFYKAQELITKDKPVYIFLSHLHLDHIDGLQTINKFNLKQGIKILTGSNMKKELLSFMRTPFMPNIDSMPSKIEIIEEEDFKTLPLNLVTLPLLHAVPTTALRWETEGKVLVCALDTGWTDNLIKISDKADLLITEAAFLPGDKPNNNHITPEEAARAALFAGAKKLALIHFKADDYTSFELRDKACAAAKEIFANTICPKDGDSIEI